MFNNLSSKKKYLGGFVKSLCTFNQLNEVASFVLVLRLFHLRMVLEKKTLAKNFISTSRQRMIRGNSSIDVESGISNSSSYIF